MSAVKNMAWIETSELTTRSGLAFTADVAGPAGGALVLLLHGFPESRHSWRARAARTREGGLSRRRARPARLLAGRAARSGQSRQLRLRQAGRRRDRHRRWRQAHAGKRFHLVGHDWGGQVSWGVASTHPERLASLTVLSRPHPLSFRRALAGGPEATRSTARAITASSSSPTPRTSSWPTTPSACARASFGQECPTSRRGSTSAILGNRDGARRRRLPGIAPTRACRATSVAIKVPTLYIWGDADATVGAGRGQGHQASS